MGFVVLRALLKLFGLRLSYFTFELAINTSVLFAAVK